MTMDASGVDPEAMGAFGAQVDFGRTAGDYARHRAGFPQAFFDLLAARGWAGAGQMAVDLGTGTGTVARGLARLGLTVTGVDPAAPMMAQAAGIGAEEGLSVTYREARAEETGLATGAADLVTAGQCWHWFDRAAAADEARRLLTPGGRLVIAHFDWLPLPGNVVAATEALILDANPDWAGAGSTGLYPAWLLDMAQAGFAGLETASFDVAVPYSHAAWRGRIRASAGIAASLTEDDVAAFDHRLAACLARDFPADPLLVPHRVWLVTGTTPGVGVE